MPRKTGFDRWTFWSLAVLDLITMGLDFSFFCVNGVDSTSIGSAILLLLACLATMVFIILGSVSSESREQIMQVKKVKLRGCMNLVWHRMPGLLVVCWIITATTCLVVAARQPVCLPHDSIKPLWQQGLTCRLHRSMSAMSVIMLLILCSLFCSYELTKHSIDESVSVLDEKTMIVHSLSESSGSSDLAQRARLYLIPDSRISPIEHEQWLQRRNSMSSHNAIFPDNYRTFDRRYRRPRRTPSTLGSLSETDIPDFAELQSIYTVSTGRTRHAWSGCPSRSSKRSSYLEAQGFGECDRQNLLSRQALRPLTVNTTIRRHPSPPPPAWYPSTLRHGRLSSDPAIRALSMGTHIENDHIDSLSNSVKPPAVPHRDHRRTRCSSNTPVASSRLRLQSRQFRTTKPQPDILEQSFGTASEGSLVTTKAAKFVRSSSAVMHPNLRRPSPIRSKTQVNVPIYFDTEIAPSINT